VVNSIKNTNQEFFFESSSSENHQNIVNLLRKNSFGLTIAEISRMLKITRNTTAVYLARLEGANQVRIRKVGMAKLYSLKPEQTKLMIKERH